MLSAIVRYLRQRAASYCNECKTVSILPPKQQVSGNVPVDRIVVNEVVAQSYLGIVLKKPPDARRRKYKVWGELYEKMFSGQVAEPYVVAILLHRAVTEWVSTAGLAGEPDDLLRKVANNGVFHIARIAAHLWRGTDNWNDHSSELKKQIQILKKNPASLSKIFEKAFTNLVAVVSANHYRADLDLALKSNTLDADIDKMLYASRDADT